MWLLIYLAKENLRWQAEDVLKEAFLTLLSTEEDAEVGEVDKKKAVGEDEDADEVTEGSDEGEGGVWLG